MSEEKKYLDDVGLEVYDTLMKNHVDTKLAEAKGYSDTNLTSAMNYADAGDESVITTAQSYTDSAVAQKSQVQIITWEADD